MASSAPALSVAAFPPLSFASAVHSVPSFPSPRYSPPISPVQTFSTSSSFASLSPSSSTVSLSSSPVGSNYQQQTVFKRQRLEPLILAATPAAGQSAASLSSVTFPPIQQQYATEKQPQQSQLARRRKRAKSEARTPSQSQGFDASVPPLLTLTVPSRTSWFSFDDIDAIEKRSLTEFFPKRQPSVTLTEPLPALPFVKSVLVSDSDSELSPSSYRIGPTHAVPITHYNYMQYRNSLIINYHLDPSQYLTVTEARRSVPVSVSAVMRLHAFLEQWGLINSQCHPTSAAATSLSYLPVTDTEVDTGAGEGSEVESVSSSAVESGAGETSDAEGSDEESKGQMTDED